MKRLFSAIVLWGLSGCFTYVPVESAVPEPGQEVRVHLSPSLDVDVGAVIVRDVTMMEGALYRVTSDTLAVWTQWIHSLGGSRYYANGQVHVMDRKNVPRLEVRQLHAGRTILATVLTLGVGAGVFAFTADLGAEGGGEGGGGSTEQRIVAAIPLIGLPRIP